MRSLLKNKVCKTNPSIELQLENLNSLILLPTKGADATAAEDDDEVDSNEAMLIDMFLNSSRLVKKIQVVDCSDLATALKLYAIRVLLGNLRHVRFCDAHRLWLWVRFLCMGGQFVWKRWWGLRCFLFVWVGLK